MSKRETFLLRIDPKILAGLKKWASDDLRSTNSLLEYLLRDCLIKSGRLDSRLDSEENSGRNDDSNLSE